MATVTVWQSSTGIWTEASSWSDGVPTNVKIARFDGTSQVSVRGDAVAPIAYRIETHPEYTGDIGDPGNHLAIQLHDSAVIRGQGNVYLSPAVVAPGYIVMNANRWPMAELHISSATVEQLNVLAGRVFIHDGVTNIACRLGLYGPLAYVEGQGTSNAISYQVVIRGGTFINHKLLDSVEYAVLGGNVTEYSRFDNTDTITIDGGHMVHIPATAPAIGTPPKWQLLSGTLDVSKSKYPVYGTFILIGPDFNLIGELVEVAANPYEKTIDLREEYP